MGYNFYSQLQGPQIDVNLFPDSFSKGVSAGNALGTPLSSAVAGITKGIETGQQITENQQTIESNDLGFQIKQNQVNNLPIANQAEQAQADSATALAKIHTLDAQNAATENALKLQDTESQLQQDTQKNQDELQLRKDTNNFVTTFKAADPQTQAQMVLDPSNSILFSKNKDLFQTAGNQVWADQNNGLDELTRNNLGKILKVQGISQGAEAEARKNLQDYQAQSANITNQHWAVDAAAALQTTPTDAASQVKFVPHGAYQYQDGKIVVDPQTNSWKQNDKYDAAGSKGQWDLVSNDGQVLNGVGSLTDHDKKSSDDYTKSANIHNGVYAQRQIQKVLAPGIPSISAPQQKLQTLSTPSSQATTEAPTTDEKQLSDNLKQSLNIPTSYVENLSPDIDALKNHIDKYLADPTSRKDPTVVAEYGNISKNIARTITDKQYEDSLAIKSLNTPNHVNAYNNELKAQLHDALLSRDSGKVGDINAALTTVMPIGEAIDEADSILGSSDKKDVNYILNSANGMYDAYKIDTPQDLYFARQYPLIQKKIDDIVDSYTTIKNKALTSTQRTQGASIKILNSMAGLSRGR